MQAILEREQQTGINIQSLPTNTIDYFVKLLEKAEAAEKSNIENKIVSLGSEAINDLIRNIHSAQGAIRGIIAMSLIRIGEDSIKPLRKEALKNQNFAWISDYIINEINNNNEALSA